MTEFDNKKKLFFDLFDPNGKPKKVPLYLNMQGYIVYNTAGYGYSEAVYNSENILNSYKKATEMFPADLYYDMGGYCSMFLSRCLGSEDYFLSDENYSLNFKDIAYLTEPTDYEKLANDPKGYLWNNFYSAKFKNLSEDKRKQTITDFLQLSSAHSDNSTKIKQEIIDRCGSLFLSDVPIYQPSFDYLFQYIVGMKNISMHMRRNKSELIDALDSLENLFNGYMDKFTPYLEKEDYPIQFQMCLLGQTLTNPKQFDTFIWPFLSKKLNEVFEKDLNFYFMVEGRIGSLMSHLEDFPKGKCLLHSEADLLEYLISRFDDRFIYAGGMPVSILGSITEDECRKYTMDVLKKYANEGNFVFTTDKGITYKRDATINNLRAVCEEVNSYEI